MIIRLRMLTAVFVIINLLMVSVMTASVAHLPDDHYSAHLSIVHSHADHDHQLHLHMVADLVSFSMIFQARTADAVSSSSSSQLVTLYYSPLLPPPNA